MSTSLREKLKGNEVALGLKLDYPAPGIIECMGAGWDWIWIDGQHGQMDYQSMLQCVRVADACGLAPIPRVPGHEFSVIGPVMDMGTAGIMVPMVNTPQQAKRVVEAVRFPPLGERSYGGRRVIDIGGREYFEMANDETLLLIQIETREAVRNAEAIAATDGVDVLFFSSDDMKMRMGIPINTRVTELDELAGAMERTICAARNAGKIGGCVVQDSASLVMAVSLGYRLIVGGGDVVFLRMASSERLKELRDAIRTSR